MKEIANGKSQSEKAVSAIINCICIGCLATLLFSFQTSTASQFLSVFGTGVLISGASLLFGALLGFLFGIPRTLQKEKTQSKPATEADKDKETLENNDTVYEVNTNLEQISDWLTKIIVGVGLIQINSFPGLLLRYAKLVHPALGGYPASKVFAITLLFFYIVCGFLICYLWTRLYFAAALIEASLATKIGQVAKKVSDIEKQTEIDAKALNIIQQQLNPASNSSAVDQVTLNEALMPSSHNIQAQIYYIARAFRGDNWQDRSKLHLMERTIPIFRALIKSDVKKIYHQSHGQLGFALKDQREPALEEAINELSIAIKMRGKGEKEGWLLYEFNRAVCRIMLDPDFENSKPSSEEIKKQILSDIKAARHAKELSDIIDEEGSIVRNWLLLNQDS